MEFIETNEIDQLIKSCFQGNADSLDDLFQAIAKQTDQIDAFNFHDFPINFTSTFIYLVLLQGIKNGRIEKKTL